MGPGALGTTYCSFTKAIEHLAERWSLLIVRELGVSGPQGFNTLVSNLPGRISRSVLAARLRRLEDLGLVARRHHGRTTAYRLTASGEALMPTMRALRDWSESWLPEDPAMVERDPDVVLAWLAKRVDQDVLPARQVIVEMTVRLPVDRRYWLVLEREADPYGCRTDPLLDQSRYLHVRMGQPVLLLLARGHRSWHDAAADGSIQAYGDPELVRQLPTWFLPAAG